MRHEFNRSRKSKSINIDPSASSREADCTSYQEQKKRLFTPPLPLSKVEQTYRPADHPNPSPPLHTHAI